MRRNVRSGSSDRAKGTKEMENHRLPQEWGEAEPETIGIPNDQLDVSSDYVRRMVEIGAIPLAEILVARRSKIVLHRSFVNPPVSTQGNSPRRKPKVRVYVEMGRPEPRNWVQVGIKRLLPHGCASVQKSSQRSLYFASELRDLNPGIKRRNACCRAELETGHRSPPGAGHSNGQISRSGPP